MKVAMLDPSFFTLPYDHHVCEALHNQGHEVRLYGRPLRRTEILPPHTYRVHTFFYRLSEKLSNRFQSRLTTSVKGLEHIVDMGRLLKELREVRPDVIHVQWFPLPLVDRYFLARLRRIAPVVLTVHDTKPFHGSPTSRLQLLGWASILNEADHLIVHTEYSRSQLVNMGLTGAKVSVVAHGVLTPVRHVASEDPSQLCSDNEKIILMFGGIKPYKGVDLLLQAYAELPAHVQSSCKIWIAGRPMMDVRPLLELAETLGVSSAIKWDLRYVPEDELPRLFQAAYMVAFPYRDIDASGVLMMALPYGKPIVATSVGGFGDVIQNGVHGFLVPPGDPSALAAAMERILEDPALASEMGGQNRRLAGETLSWDTIAERTAKIYAAVLSTCLPE